MKIFRTIFAAAALAVVSFSAIPAIAADSSGISLPGPTISESGYYLKTWSGASQGLPLIVTNAASALATNIVTPVLKDQPVNFAFRGASSAGAASNNVVAFFKFSWDGGKTYSTAPKASWTFNPNVTTEFIDGGFLSYTSLTGATHVKLDKLSNSIPAAAAAAVFYASNFTFQVRRQ